MKELKLKDFSDGIDFYMLTKQYQKVADKVEECHDKMLLGSCVNAEAQETLKYYAHEKAILLGKMKEILDRADLFIKEEQNVS